MKVKIAFCLGLSVFNCLGASALPTILQSSSACRFLWRTPKIIQPTAQQQALSFKEFDWKFKKGLFVPADALKVSIESIAPIDGFSYGRFVEPETVSTSLFCLIMNKNVTPILEEFIGWRAGQSGARIYDEFNYAALNGFAQSQGRIKHLADTYKYPVAQFIIGRYYEIHGDISMARTYYRAAADQEHTEALMRFIALPVN